MLQSFSSKKSYPSTSLSVVKWIGAGAAAFASTATLAQVIAPSQVTPREIAPESPSPSVEVPVEQAASARSAKQTDNFVVAIGTVKLEGTFPEMSGANAAFLSSVSHKRQRLSDLFEAARDLEQAYAQAGYVFARVVVPPQRLAEGAAVEVRVIDGYVESLDVSRLPASIQAPVRRRISHIVGQRHLTRSELERALLLAGELSGLDLRSALARGDQAGGVRLIVEGRLDQFQARIGADNRLPSSLGRWQWNGTVALNNLLGLGDQTYLFLGSQFDVGRHGFAKPTLGMVGGGLTLPISRTGISLGGELLLARTEPEPQRMAGVPLTVGSFSRAQLNLNLPFVRSRSASLDARISVDLIDQSLRFPEFATTFTQDHYAAMRMELSWRGQAGKLSRSLTLALSQGLVGRDATARLPASRQGARNDFTALQVSGRLGTPLPRGFTLDVQARAQSSFGHPLFLPEQFALDSENAVSTSPTGSFSVDTGVTLRTELGLPVVTPAHGLLLSPYFFAAGGTGSIEKPTAAEQPIAIEQATLNAAGIGIGARVDMAGLPGLKGVSTAIGIELGRQFSNAIGRSDTNRASVTASMRF